MKCDPPLEDQLRNKCKEAWKTLTGGYLLGLPIEAGWQHYGVHGGESGKAELDFMAHQETKERRIE